MTCSPDLTIPSFLRSFAIGGFVVYLGWNLFFILNGQIPPSILFESTGIPAPTTGCTRSLLALIRGDVLQSIQYNLMTIPYIVALALSFGLLARYAIQRKALLLPGWLGYCWFVALMVGWALKLSNPFSW